MSEGRLLRDLKVPIGASHDQIATLAAAHEGLKSSDVREVRIVKRSLDARRQRAPQHVLTLRLWTTEETPTPAPIPAPRVGRMRPYVAGEAPIIVGAGPAGLWAALRFIEAGEPCVLVERGQRLAGRHEGMRSLRRRGVLDPENNLCFGEGGAGTYTDGKLYTRKRAPEIRRVYEDFVAFGAQPEILVDAHPHIGTNRLIRVVDAVGRFLEDRGCELRFGTRVDGLLQDRAGRVSGVTLQSGEELRGPSVILATGHSARDVFSWLHSAGVPLAPKPFAIGVRVEHPQALIDHIQFGDHVSNPALGAAAYALTHRVSGRGVYSFCMCPGGFILPTPTEAEHLNVNGMSNAGRGSPYANAALVVTVDPEDFWREKPGDLDAHGPLSGVALQRHFERRAFDAGGRNYCAPAQRLTDFLAGRVGDVPTRTSYRPGLTAVDLTALLPARLREPLSRSVLAFDRKMPGFLTEEAVMLGFETTTSSPVRVLRDKATLTPPDVEGLYPCGEGAGWAGGIVSSALEGIRCAEAAISVLGRRRGVGGS